MEVFRVVQNAALVKYATQELTCTGKLCQKDERYIFLKISDDFIYKLFHFVPDPAKQIPNYFAASPSGEPPVGAHISVIYPEELSARPNLKEMGEFFTFKIKDPFHATLRNKIYWGCTVEAPALLELRAKLGLKPALSFHGEAVPLHFTIARYPKA